MLNENTLRRLAQELQRDKRDVIDSDEAAETRAKNADQSEKFRQQEQERRREEIARKEAKARKAGNLDPDTTIGDPDLNDTLDPTKPAAGSQHRQSRYNGG